VGEGLARSHARVAQAERRAGEWYVGAGKANRDVTQIATAKSLGCDLFLSADAELIEVAKEADLQAANVETEAEKILGRLPGRSRRVG